MESLLKLYVNRLFCCVHIAMSILGSKMPFFGRIGGCDPSDRRDPQKARRLRYNL